MKKTQKLKTISLLLALSVLVMTGCSASIADETPSQLTSKVGVQDSETLERVLSEEISSSLEPGENPEKDKVFSESLQDEEETKEPEKDEPEDIPEKTTEEDVEEVQEEETKEPEKDEPVVKEEPKKEVQSKETKKEEVKKEVQSKETKTDIKKNKVEEQPKIKKEELKQSEIKKEPKPVVKKKVEPAIEKSTQPVVKKESNLVVKKETPKQGEKSKAKDVEKPKEVFQPQWSSKSETKYTTEYLNVRSTTSANSKILKTLPINTKVSVYKVTNKEGWYKLANQKGFVVAQYLTNKKPVVNTTTKPSKPSTSQPETKPVSYPANSVTVGNHSITWVYWKNVTGSAWWEGSESAATSVQNAVDKEANHWVNIMTQDNLFSINGSNNLWVAAHSYNSPGKQIYHIPKEVIITDRHGVSATYTYIDRAKTYNYIGTGTYGSNDVFIQTSRPDGVNILHYRLSKRLN